MSVYVQILDSIQNGKKGVMSGQMSLFDIVSEEEKAELEIKMPDVGEYDKELLLSFEKEVLGFYVSGHPMEEYEALWSKYIFTQCLRIFSFSNTCRREFGQHIKNQSFHVVYEYLFYYQKT